MNKIDGDDACMRMHTALQKVCDSKITSSVYNMIHLCEVKPAKYSPWGFLGQLVADRLNSGEKPVKALRNAHEEFEDRFFDLFDHRAKPPSNARTWLYALSCAMGCFSKADWEGMAAYLEDE